jgi:hypothetical protein
MIDKRGECPKWGKSGPSTRGSFCPLLAWGTYGEPEGYLTALSACTTREPPTLAQHA